MVLMNEKSERVSLPVLQSSREEAAEAGGGTHEVSTVSAAPARCKQAFRTVVCWKDQWITKHICFRCRQFVMHHRLGKWTCSAVQYAQARVQCGFICKDSHAKQIRLTLECGTHAAKTVPEPPMIFQSANGQVHAGNPYFPLHQPMKVLQLPILQRLLACYTINNMSRSWLSKSWLSTRMLTICSRYMHA